MLIRVRRFGKLGGYAGLRKLMRSDAALRSVDILELRGSGAHVVAAVIDDDTHVRPLAEGVQAYRRAMIKPELTCGNKSALDAAGFEVVRRLRLADDGRAFEAVP